jgi:DNA-binding CsgD family transcriptional regulator
MGPSWSRGLDRMIVLAAVRMTQPARLGEGRTQAYGSRARSMAQGGIVPQPTVHDAPIGREAEIRAIHDALFGEAAVPRAIVIEGEPGIGKSALWRYAVELAEREQGARVLAVRPAHSELRLSWAALADLLEPIDEPMLAVLPPPQRRAVDIALLRAEPEVGLLDPRAVYTGFAAIMRGLAEDRPLVIAIDDLQWLDAASTSALDFAVRRINTGRLTYILAARTGNETSVTNLVHSLAQVETRLIPLGPMSDRAVRLLLTAHAEHPMRGSVLKYVQHLAGGNPLFALELARLIQSSPGEDPESVRVPEELQAAVTSRMMRLPAATRRALLVAAASSDARADLLDAKSLSRATAAGLVRVRGDRLEFAHPLYASALYEAASNEERRQAHARLAAESSSQEERARHHSLASSAPNRAVAAELDLAAQGAKARGAPESAAELLESAIRFTPTEDREQEAQRAIRAAQSHFAAGDRARTRHLSEQVLREFQTGPIGSQALRLLGDVAYHESNFEAAVGFLRRAVETGDARGRAEAELGLTFALANSPEAFAAAESSQQALQAAQVAGDPGLLAEALAVSVMVRCLGGRAVDEARLARSLELEDQTRPTLIELRPTVIAGLIRLYYWRFDEARSLLQGVVKRLTERGEENEVPGVLANLAWMECWAGHPDSAVAHATEASELARLAESATMERFSLSVAALVEAMSGDPEKSRSMASQALAWYTPANSPTMALAASARALVELGEGDADAAAATLEPFVKATEQGVIPHPIRILFAPEALTALIATGQLDRAQGLAERLQVRGETMGLDWAMAIAARARAELVIARGGSPDDALCEFERSLYHHAKIDHPFELARTLLAKGRIERRARRKLAARTSLEESRRIFDGLGSVLWRRQSERELARVGLRHGPPGELTPTEMSVAELVAGGFTNREVAAELFISQRTVETNVTRIYQKLGLRSRTELARRFANTSPSASKSVASTDSF